MITRLRSFIVNEKQCLKELAIKGRIVQGVDLSMELDQDGMIVIREQHPDSTIYIGIEILGSNALLR